MHTDCVVNSTSGTCVVQQLPGRQGPCSFPSHIIHAKQCFSGWGVARLVDFLSIMCEVLGLTPTMSKLDVVVYAHNPSTQGHPWLHVGGQPVLTNLYYGVILLNLGIWGLGRWPNGQSVCCKHGDLKKFRSPCKSQAWQNMPVTPAQGSENRQSPSVHTVTSLTKLVSSRGNEEICLKKKVEGHGDGSSGKGICR